MVLRDVLLFLLFFDDTANTYIYTLSLHDALPIFKLLRVVCESASYRNPALILECSNIVSPKLQALASGFESHGRLDVSFARSEEHTSELQSHVNLVCRLLL